MFYNFEDSVKKKFLKFVIAFVRKSRIIAP